MIGNYYTLDCWNRDHIIKLVLTGIKWPFNEPEFRSNLIRVECYIGWF
jgi:hypothetical protein